MSSELQVTGEVTKATSFTSDLIELVSGVCPVNLSSMPVSSAIFTAASYVHKQGCCKILTFSPNLHCLRQVLCV